jgi:hypothetical protein
MLSFMSFHAIPLFMTISVTHLQHLLLAWQDQIVGFATRSTQIDACTRTKAYTCMDREEYIPGGALGCLHTCMQLSRNASIETVMQNKHCMHEP